MRSVWGFLLAILFAAPVAADTLRLAATTSFENSGLSEVLLPAAEQALGHRIELVVVGTGQALRLGKAGDVDAVLVHFRAAEEAFVDAGYAPYRREIMFNDFVVVGPSDDPADVGRATSASSAFSAIDRKQALFVSRGDDSGTHQREVALWQTLPGGVPDADWYRSVGAGMGAALNAAAGMGAYVLSDRASWMNFANKRNLSILFDGDPALFNQYAYLPVSAERHPHVESELASGFEDWLTAPEAQAIIGAFTIDGESVFFPNASPLE